MDVKQQIQILLSLQAVDARVMEINARLKELPLKLDENTKDIRAMEAVVSAEREELEVQERWRAEKEEEHAFLEAQITRTRQQIQGVRAHRDAMALQRQLEASRKQLSDLDEEMLQTMQAMEARKESFTKHETDLTALKQHLASEEVELRSEMETLQGELTSLSAEREERSVGLEPEVKRQYQTVAARRHPSVVEALDGRCTGCNMSLRPQLYNMLFHANSLEVCPMCQRMIYLRTAVFIDEEPPKG